MSGSRMRALSALPLFLLGGCDWFTDFRDQPKYEPWETENDSTPFRANPQLSVPLNGMAAPGLLVSYRPAPNVIDSIAALVGPNPVPADARSLENGRKSYQINCSVCHGPGGRGDGSAVKYGMVPFPLTSPQTVARSDGYIWGMIRNGRGLMPTYNRIPDTERWDIVNYVRGLQGRHQVVTAPAGVPGETGATLPSATGMAPTRPAPYYHRAGSQAGIPLGRPPVAPAPESARADSVPVPIAPATGRIAPAPTAPAGATPAADSPAAAPAGSPAARRTATPTDTTIRGSRS